MDLRSWESLRKVPWNPFEPEFEPEQVHREGPRCCLLLGCKEFDIVRVDLEYRNGKHRATNEPTTDQPCLGTPSFFLCLVTSWTWGDRCRASRPLFAQYRARDRIVGDRCAGRVFGPRRSNRGSQMEIESNPSAVVPSKLLAELSLGSSDFCQAQTQSPIN